MGWEFHFRNFSQQPQTFGVFHAGCAGGDVHTGRSRCWQKVIPNNPTGGDDSVYAPSGWVVDFGDWLSVMKDVGELFADIAIYIGSEGDDEDALVDAISDATSLSADIIQAKLAESQYDAAALIQLASQNLEQTCQQIGQSTQQVVSYMEQMGFGSSGWGLIAGPSYQKNIYNDSQIVNGWGWTVLTHDGPNSVHWQHIANHAFIQNGHIIQMYDPNNVNGFWNKF
jgi:hypothetical protein